MSKNDWTSEIFLMSKTFLEKLKPTCYQILYDQGFFKEPLKVDIHYDLKPWLYSRIFAKVATQHQAKKMAQNFAAESKFNSI